jgi:hypothetical protein
MNTELLLRVQRSDPAPPDEGIPHGVWNAQQVLEELQRRTDTPLPQRPRTQRGWLIAAAAAIVIVVLIGGIGVLTRIQDNPDVSNIVDQVEPEEPTVVEQVEPDEQPVDGDDDGETSRLTEDVPPGVESGTLTTPVGAAHWVRLSGDDPLPGNGQAIAWPSGFAIFERPFNSFPPPAPVSRSAQLWVSDDGIEWRVQPLPLDAAAQDASLTLVEGVYWLLSSDPAGLWRSTDGANWDEIDSAGLLPPGPIGLMWRTSYTPPVTAGALTLSHASFEADFPFHDILPLLIEDYEPFSDRDDSCGTLRESEPGVFQIVGQQGDQPCPHQLALRFEETETGLLVRDNATGEELGEVLGADLSHIERLAQ